MSAAAAPEDPILPVYVDPEKGDDANDGKTWATALKTVLVAKQKTDLAAYYNERRVQVTLAKGTYVLDPFYLTARMSLVGDPDCDRSEVVLTAPEGSEKGGFIFLNKDPADDFVVTIANLTISNVTVKVNQGAVVNLNGASAHAHDRWSKVVSNVVITCCRQTAGSGNAGVNADGRTLVTDCLFLANDGKAGGMGTCANGGWFRNCRFESCTNATVSSASPVAYAVVEGCTFTNNCSGVSWNGGVSNIPVVRDCLFVDNVSDKNGWIGRWTNDKDGYFTNSPPVVANCAFVRNVGREQGCGATVLSFGCGGTVTNCTFVGNVQKLGCAGVVDALDVIDCTFTSNTCTASASGALQFKNNAAYAWRTPRVAGCTFVGNSASWHAGAISAFTNVTIESCLFEGNSATTGNGGAVYAESGVTVSNCVFSGNSAKSNGGGLAFNSWKDVSATLVADCVFTNNAAGAGGYACGGGGIYSDCNFKGSTAGEGLTVRNCLFVDNVLTATNTIAFGSAAVLSSRSKSPVSVRVESCTMVANRGGVALFVDDGGGGTFVTNTVIALNVGRDGAYVSPVSGYYSLSATMAEKIGHSYLHPNKGASGGVSWDGRHVTQTDVAPGFDGGTWIPSARSALRDAGVFQDWMDGAFDLRRDADGLPFVSRVHGLAVDIGAFERECLGALFIVR